MERCERWGEREERENEQMNLNTEGRDTEVVKSRIDMMRSWEDILNELVKLWSGAAWK